MNAELPLTTVHPDPRDAPGMDWLEAVAGLAPGKRMLTVQECAESVSMSDAGVIKLIQCGQLESVRAGTRAKGDHRIPRSRWLMHLWYGWSHRHQATRDQIGRLVIELLGGLPSKWLKIVALKCTELLKSREAAGKEAKAGQLLGKRPTSNIECPTSKP